jgi:hypothetical protein
MKTVFEPQRPDGDAPATFDASVLVLRRNWVAPAIALAFAFAGVVYEQTGRPAAPVGWFVAWMGLVFAGVSIARDAFPHATKATLRASETTLTIGGESLATETIAEAKTIPVPNGEALVVLTLRDGKTRTLQLKKTAAEAMVRVLGIAAGERRTTFSLVLPFRTRFLATLLIVGVPWLAVVGWRSHGDTTGLLVMSLLFNVLPLAALTAWLASLLRGRLVVGADGFLVKWFVHERFVPYAEVKAMRSGGPWWNQTQVDTFVETKTARVRLRAREAPVTEAQRGAQGRALHEHLAQALARAKGQSPEAENVAALLGAGSRNGVEWLAHLDALVHGGTSRYRVAAPGPDLLARIANDAATATPTRIGAAAALVRSGDQGRRVVRVAADACAEPKLREVLVRLSESDSDEAIAELLTYAARTP